ncbi:hypothetical protein GmHk_12G034677 [Glycine max]|nr:hypothetical protein GmHk_12G034677 [Glycine max]
MASRKRKSTASQSWEPYDTTRFISEVAWERYSQNVHSRNILLERNVILYVNDYDEFHRELERRCWHKALTRQLDGHIDVALVKEFYSNLYDPKDKSPKQVRVRGKLIKFDVESLNTFLKTPVILEPGELYTTYTRFCHSRPDPQEFAARLCIPGHGFVLNDEEVPWKLLRKDLITLAQTWSVLSYSNLAPTSHRSNLNMDRARLVYGLVMKMDMDVGSLISHQISQMAQSNSSRHGFPALITTLCIARGVISDSLSFESLGPAINLAYIKKNCWNLDDLLVTFLGTRKARARGSEGPSSATFSFSTPTPSTSAPPLPPSPSLVQTDTSAPSSSSL